MFFRAWSLALLAIPQARTANPVPGSLTNKNKPAISETRKKYEVTIYCYASGAPWVSKSTHPRKFGNHVTVHTNEKLGVVCECSESFLDP